MSLFDNIEHKGSKTKSIVIPTTAPGLKDIDSIVQYVVSNGLLEQRREQYPELVARVQRLCEHSRDHLHIHKTVQRHYDELMTERPSWTPTLFTLGALLFGSYLPSYATKNKYCSLIAADAIPKFTDTKRSCRANLVYLGRRGVEHNVDNKRGVCFVDLENSLPDELTQQQCDELYDYGCKKIITRKENRMLESKKILPPQTEKGVTFDLNPKVVVYRTEEEPKSPANVKELYKLLNMTKGADEDDEDPFAFLVQDVVHERPVSKPKHLDLVNRVTNSNSLYDDILNEFSDCSSDSECSEPGCAPVPVIDEDPFACLVSAPLPECWKTEECDLSKKKVIVEPSNVDALDVLLESQTSKNNVSVQLVVLGILVLLLVYIGMAIYFNTNRKAWL